MATSITNTSVTTDNLTVDTNVLHVDSTNNRVGIGTSTPLSTVHQDVGLTSRDGYKLFYGTDPKAAFTVHPSTGEIRIGAATVGTSGNYYTEIMSRNGSNLVTSIKADNYGRVTMPNQPSFMAYGGWNYQASTYIWQGFATVDHNIGSHWNNSTGRFTAPVAGRYMIYATAHHSTASTYHLWAFLKNGSLGGGNWVQSYDVNGGNHTTSKTQVWNLAAGDYLEVASNATYANAYLGGYVTVGGHLVG